MISSFLQKRRMQGWSVVDRAAYLQAYQQFGGSVLSHPEVLTAIEAVADLPIQYYAFEQAGELQAVIPVWKKYIAGSKLGLKKMSRKGLVDFGNAEFILPISANTQLELPVQVDNLSRLHADNVSNAAPSNTAICLSKPHSEFSKKFRYNRKRELRLLEEQGGEIKSIDSLSNEELVDIYSRLFELRWGFKPKAYQGLVALLTDLRPLLFGCFIEMEGQAIAFQLIYKTECQSHISMEYVNGGVDPAFKSLSPGSVLTYLNTQQAWALSESTGKTLRYSFGKADNEYKDRWCSQSAIYSV
ncbi:hypothetical protein A9Q80_02470 [Cycloclasticus sp. 46_83_sub15_T18]|nr:hypothetical protein A9Q80_02470 [Cycloclasticus sp. 46_83_sub15_T18]OUR84309.1 hypothetical protein A9Q82_00745 [Cycloclasticus sp. 46_120_T64]